MTRSILIAGIALLATACAETPPLDPVPPAENTANAAALGTCATDFVEVVATAPACGVALGADGSLTVDGRHYPPIAVSYQQDAAGQVAIPAKKLILFPPPAQSGTRIIQACEGTEPNSLCWAVRLMNPQSGTLREVTAGKYGPERWISWSPQGRRAALVSRNEGAMWLYVVDGTTGATTAYPDAAENADWQIEPDSFAWNGDDAFTVQVRTCATCAPQERRFTLP